MNDTPEPARFEDLLTRLEALVDELETDELDLERALEAFEEGMRLARECHRRLDQAERRVERLRQDPDDPPSAEPFDPETP